MLEGKKLDWTFVQDFALAEWGSGEDGVEETYHKVIKEWGNRDYKAFTQIAMALNILAWFNDTLSRQGFENRGSYTEFYSEFWYRARDEFYNKFGENQEAYEYFFEMTD